MSDIAETNTSILTNTEPTPELESIETLSNEVAVATQETEKIIDEDSKERKAFAQIAREQRRMREQKQALKAEQERFQAEKQELEMLRKAKRLLDEDPSEALKLIGTDYDKITNKIYDSGKTNTEKQLAAIQAELELFRQAQAEEQKKIQAQHANQQIELFLNKVSSEIKSSSDEFPTLAKYGGADIVYQIVNERLEAGESADEMFLEDLLEEAEAQMAAYEARLNRKKGAKASPSNLIHESKPESKTLTNQNAVSQTQVNSANITREESLRRAAQLIKYT